MWRALLRSRQSATSRLRGRNDGRQGRSLGHEAAIARYLERRAAFRRRDRSNVQGGRKAAFRPSNWAARQPRASFLSFTTLLAVLVGCHSFYEGSRRGPHRLFEARRQIVSQPLIPKQFRVERRCSSDGGNSPHQAAPCRGPIKPLTSDPPIHPRGLTADFPDDRIVTQHFVLVQAIELGLRRNGAGAGLERSVGFAIPNPELTRLVSEAS